MDYQELCVKKLKSLSNEEYNKYYSLYMDAVRGAISWEDFWNKHLKTKDSKISIRDVVR